jgi:hypothetical protein
MGGDERNEKHERQTVDAPMALAEEHLAALEYDRRNALSKIPGELNPSISPNS